MANAASGSGSRRAIQISSSSLDQPQPAQAQPQPSAPVVATARRGSSAFGADLSLSATSSGQPFKQQQIQYPAEQQQQHQQIRRNSATATASQMAAAAAAAATASTQPPPKNDQNEYVSYYHYQKESQQQPESALSHAAGFITSRPQASKQAEAQLYNPSSSGAATRSSPYIKDDIDIVFNRLMALEAFRKLHPTVIRNLCSYAFIERIDKGVIVFRQGDDAINWYALLEGSVDVKVAQSGGQKEGVTLCTLGVGTTFGASVTPGKSHSVSVVTSDDCTLLRVRRADFQEIFNEQSHLINNVESSPFCSFTSLNRLSQQTSLPLAGASLQQRPSGGNAPANSRQQPLASGQLQVRRPSAGQLLEASDSDQAQQDELADLNLDSMEPNELSSHLMRIGWVLRTLMLNQCVKMIQNRRIHPQAMHRHHQQSKRLVSVGSSSQLLSSQASANSTKSTGRKVASYVASSFMRTNSKSSTKSSGAGSSSNQPFFASNSFDANQTGPAPPTNLSRATSFSEPVLFKRCMLGREMVDWLLELGVANTNAARFVGSRLQAISMWQVLLEQGIIFAYSKSEESSSPQQQQQQSSEQLARQQAESCCQFQFCDDQQAYYKFWFDREDGNVAAGASQLQQQQQQQQPLTRPGEQDVVLAHESLWWALKVLSKLAPDACFRLILSKRPHERSYEEVDIVFEELQHLKALSHLTNSVKKELAACVTSEHRAKQNTVLFNQGDPGQSWYIILRGSVNVVIVGKGVVCTLHEGDDFGKLALVNDAPRAATIVTNEPNCYFLRVDKHNFNTILRDVEANTVRLKEHGKEVLILQKVPAKEAPPSQVGGQAAPDQASASAASLGSSALQGSESVPATAPTAAANSQTIQSSQPTLAGPASAAPAGLSSSALKYMVMAGTSEKMLEHLLETRIDGHTQMEPLTTGKSNLIQHDQVSSYIQCHGDNFLEDFILTHKIFMPTSNLCNELLKQYQCQTKSQLSGSNSAQSGSLASQTASGEHTSLDDEYLVAKKRRVVKFIRCWMLITREHFFQQQQIQSFLTTIHLKVKQDAARFSSLQAELKAVSKILELHLEEDLESRHKGVQRWIDDIYGNILPIRRHSGSWDLSQSASKQASELFLASLHQRRFEHKLSTIQPDDEVVFRVYCADHTFTTLKTRVDEKASEIKLLAASKLNLEDKELILVHVKSNGERIIYNDLESNISTSLSVNGRIFVCPLDHISAICPLPEQDPFQEVYSSGVVVSMADASAASRLNNGTNNQTDNNKLTSNNQQTSNVLASQNSILTASNQTTSSNTDISTATTTTTTNSSSALSSHLLQTTPTNYNDIKAQMSLSVSKIEEFSSRDVAYCLTQLAWSLLKNMHEFELIYTVFGRHNFKQITANLNVFLRHFNEIQYWVVTQICLSTSLSKRVQILRKFIKIAAHCKELQNLNAFYAIIMGLSNMAVARLTQTWERLPSKLKRTFSQFESLIDPSRNHRRYRIFISKMEPPIIPFMPLFLKDMTFAHEGNKTYLENGLINFEKMQMVAQTLRTIRYCKSKPMKLDSSACKFKGSIRSIELFFRDLKIIDNQRTLTQMSHQLEHRKT